MTLPGGPANKLGNRYETCRRFAPLPDAGVPPASEGRPAPATGGGASISAPARLAVASGDPMKAAERRGWAALPDARCGSGCVTARRALRGTAPPPPVVRPRRGRVGVESYEERED